MHQETLNNVCAAPMTADQIDLPGVIGGDPQLDQSRTEVSADSRMSVHPSKPSSPENMGFMGVWSASQLLGLPMVLPEVDNGGVEGKYEFSYNSVSSMMAGFTGWGEAVGVITEGPLLYKVGGCEQAEPGLE